MAADRQVCGRVDPMPSRDRKAEVLEVILDELGVLPSVAEAEIGTRGAMLLNLLQHSSAAAFWQRTGEIETGRWVDEAVEHQCQLEGGARSHTCGTSPVTSQEQRGLSHASSARRAGAAPKLVQVRALIRSPVSPSALIRFYGFKVEPLRA